MKNNLLWKLEEDFKETKRNYINKLMYEKTTVKELLDMGFNNNYICFNMDSYNLGFKDLNGDYYSDDFELNDEQLSCEVVLDETDEDSDCYTIIYVKLKNEKDKKYFIKNNEIEINDCDDKNLKLSDLKKYCLNTISSNFQYDYNIGNITTTDDSIIINDKIIVEINIKNGGGNND